MIILGIDPGTQRVGYGLIEKEQGNKLRLLEAGLLSVKSKDPVTVLMEIKKHMDKLLEQWDPDVVAIEKLYLTKNQKTVMSVAEARGVMLLAIGERGIPIREYGPAQMKLGVTGYGSADKAAVLKMVRLILKEPALAVIDDASDALALAIVASGDASGLGR